jgi:hypothetical protein
MYKILTGNYRQGHLVLDETLDSHWEGKRVSSIVYEVEESSTKKQKFFDWVDQQSFDLPLDGICQEKIKRSR